jgi:hypothetical protein
MTKSYADGEVDTHLEVDGKLKVEPNSLLMRRPILAKEGFTTSSDPQTKTFHYSDFENVGYGELILVALSLVQTGDGAGHTVLSFNQRMRCAKSNVVSGPDLVFSGAIFDSAGNVVRNVHLGTWDRVCGEHPVYLPVRMDWAPGSVSPVESAAWVDIVCDHYLRVHNC